VARIEQALEAGRVVIVPERPVTIGNAPRSGWWEVDPATGHTLDRLDDGRGAELGEYLLFIHELATWAMCITALGYAIVAVVRAAWKEAVTAGAVGAGMCIAAGGGGVPHFPH
jgi:hypothetical protein